MIIIFGWIKEAKPVRPALRSYCYHCQRKTTWHLWRETEWVSFFAVKSVPFLWKNFLVCEGCEDSFPLDRSGYVQLASPQMQALIAGALEEKQLAPKNEVQRNFLLIQRAEREAREAAAA